MTRTHSPIRDIIIVDPHPDDYAPLLASGVLPDAVFHFATTAEAALKIQFLPSLLEGAGPGVRGSDHWPLATDHSCLWLINIQLPDLTGFELCEQLRDRDPHVVALLVGNEHDPFAELESRSRWPMPFVCKPPQVAWLECSLHAPREVHRQNLTRSVRTTLSKI